MYIVYDENSKDVISVTQPGKICYSDAVCTKHIFNKCFFYKNKLTNKGCLREYVISSLP